MRVETTSHLIIPFARCNSDGWLEAVAPLQLRTLGQLLRGMQLVDTDSGQADSLSPPHERAFYTAAYPAGNGRWADGLIPRAALEADERQIAEPEQGWAFITPCHWAMGREHATMTNPRTLDITADESRILLDAMQPYFATHGITLHYIAPSHWLAEGDTFRRMPTASLDRVISRNVDRWLPASKAMKLLQNEMQMLLYTHPINDERSARGQRSVNSFWLSGSGTAGQQEPVNSQVSAVETLAQSAFSDDWTSYANGWAEVDTSHLAQLLAKQKNGKTVRLTLCSESNTQTFETSTPGFFTRISNTFSPPKPLDVLKQL